MAFSPQAKGAKGNHSKNNATFLSQEHNKKTLPFLNPLMSSYQKSQQDLDEQEELENERLLTERPQTGESMISIKTKRRQVKAVNEAIRYPNQDVTQ